MSRPRIQITPHLDYAELIQRYQNCQNPKVKNYWLVIQLLSQPDTPLTAEQVAERLGLSTDWVRKLAHRYNRLGPDGLADLSQAKKRGDRRPAPLSSDK
ncbi:helix-turn-helix domain-containing protein [Phormidium tenue FACHB-886]|nr:helix-turn-helix domain-containing protein [Phormidium tenue FACHB-886]